jgi:hypothetical protein
MRLPWIKEARLIDPGMPPNLRVIELQTAKEILAEVFHTLPGKVEEMIQMRLEEIRPEEVRQEDGPWPREFCLGE